MTVQSVLYIYLRQLIASMVLLLASYSKKDAHDEVKIKNVCLTKMRLRKRLEIEAQPCIIKSRNQAKDI